MSKTIYLAMTIFGVIGIFVFWGLNHAYSR
jgi:hypothetical protein